MARVTKAVLLMENEALKNHVAKLQRKVELSDALFHEIMKALITYRGIPTIREVLEEAEKPMTFDEAYDWLVELGICDKIEHHE